MEGIIYLARDGDYVKIGWTTDLAGARARLGSFQIGNPRTLDMRVLCNGDRDRERALHALHASNRVRGEWFQLDAVRDLWDRSKAMDDCRVLDRYEELVLPELPAAGEGGRSPKVRDGAIVWLGAFLAANGPTPTARVYKEAAEAGHKPKTIRRAADDLGVKRVPPGGGPKCQWEL